MGGGLRNTLALVQNLNEIDLRMQHRAFEVIGKEEIAATTDMQHRTRKLLEFDIHKVCYRIILDETAGLHLHTEGVHLCKILIIRGLYHN